MGEAITRRRALFSLLALAGAGLSAAACGPKVGTQAGGLPGSTEGIDFSVRFAAYEAADEPNGDLAKVTWPAFVTRAGPEVRALYEFQIIHGELMRYMPCFCGCGANGHRNNRDCYVRVVNPDGSVVFDPMAPTWEICLGVTRDVISMLDQGMTPRSIRAAIDAKYAQHIDQATPTPYPQA